MKKGKFVGKVAKEISEAEIEKLISLVSEALAPYGVTITETVIEDGFHGKYIRWYVDGLNYANRNSRRTLVSTITQIKCAFMAEKGFSTYEYGKENNFDVSKVDDEEYSFSFSTDGSYREYRHKNWIHLEGAGHYTFNDSLDDAELKEDIQHYIDVICHGMKGKVREVHNERD